MSSGGSKVGESRGSAKPNEKTWSYRGKRKTTGNPNLKKAGSKPMLAYGDSGASLFQSKQKLRVSPRGSIMGVSGTGSSTADSDGMASWLMSARDSKSSLGSGPENPKQSSMKISTVELDAWV